MRESFRADEYKKLLTSADNIHSCPKVPLPKIDEKQNYIFVSYSHKDFKLVYSDLADMYEAGVRFWYDSGLSAGKIWTKEVEDRIRSPYCVGVIYYISENLFLSKSAIREIEIMQQYKENQNSNKNYFSVNLTDVQPVEILFSALEKDRTMERNLNMERLRILGQAFPDEATYVHYNSSEHEIILVSQIRTQFGVIDDIVQKHPFDIDNSASSVFVGTTIESLASPDRQGLLHELEEYLTEKGVSVYISQSNQNSALNISANQYVNGYVDQQNAVKFEQANILLILTTVIGWGISSRYLEKYDGNKKIIYLIDDSSIDMEKFTSFYCNINNDEGKKDILHRVFFASQSDYKEKIAEYVASTAK